MKKKLGKKKVIEILFFFEKYDKSEILKDNFLENPFIELFLEKKFLNYSINENNLFLYMKHKKITLLIIKIRQFDSFSLLV